MKYKDFRIYITIVLTILLLHQENNLLSQSELLGNPFIENYSKEQYSGGAQNWDSYIMDNGYVLMANDKGLLEFDGISWKTYPLPNRTIVRSLCVTESRIYIGGQDELGYLSISKNGTLEYHSIRHLIPKMFLPLQDVWQLKVHDQKIYARSVNRIYIFDPINEAFEVVDPKSILYSIFVLDDKMYCTNLSKGILAVQDTTEIHPYSDLLNSIPITGALSYNDKAVFATENLGLFCIKDNKLLPINKKTNDYLIQHKIFCITKLFNDNIAIGTQFGGLIIIDKEGNIVRKIDSDDGLTNNNVHTITQDQSGHIWVGTSNGINYIALESAINKIPIISEIEGTFYNIKAYKNNLYFGSNNALYGLNLSKGADNFSEREYKKITNSQGQVWGLDIVDGDLLMGHNNGAFIIKDGSSKKISNEPGAWKFIEARNSQEMYVGTYDGIDIYKKSNGSWKFFKKLEGFIESARIMISVKPNEVWVSHPYRGVYKIEHDNDYFVKRVTLYDERQGLPSILANYIFEINGTPYVAAKTGIYYFDRVYDKFVKDVEMNRQIDSTKNVRRLFQEKEDKIWFIAEHEAGYLEKEKEGTYKKVLYPDLVDKYVNGFEEMYFYTKNQALICGIDDVLSLNLNHERKITKPRAFITKVQLRSHNDSLLYGGNNSSQAAFSKTQSEEQIPILEYNHNELLFTHCSPSHKEGTLYSYALTKGNGISVDPSNWSIWSKVTTKEYNNLPSGKYTYSVRAKSQNEVIGDYTNYEFTIKPPWYYSTFAKVIYWLFALGMLSALIFIPRKKFKEEKLILTTAKEESDAKLEAVKTEKLKAEIDFKNSELASSTMHLVQKNETINKIRQDIQSVSKKIKDPDAKKEIRKILSLFSDDDRLEDEWENFSRHFDKVHTDFLKRISSKYTQLTPKDKKLCAYLRMNLSTKEIAPLLNISVRGVEISRYRLRKKIELDKEINLNEFMMNF